MWVAVSVVSTPVAASGTASAQAFLLKLEGLGSPGPLFLPLSTITRDDPTPEHALG